MEKRAERTVIELSAVILSGQSVDQSVFGAQTDGQFAPAESGTLLMMFCNQVFVMTAVRVLCVYE